MTKIEYIAEREAPAPPKPLSKTATETLRILQGIKDGQVARLTVEEGGQTVRGLRSSIARVAKNQSLKVQAYQVPTEPEVLYVRKVK